LFKLLLVKLRKHLLQVRNLGQVIDGNVRIVRVQGRIILVISLRGIKGLQRDDLRDNASMKHFGLSQLRDVGIGNTLLVGVRIRNHRAVLRAFVWALAVELRWVVDDGEEHLEQLAVRNLRRVKRHLYGFRVAGTAATYHLVFGSGSVAAGVSGGRVAYALHMLKDGLHTPETSAGKDRGLRARTRGERS